MVTVPEPLLAAYIESAAWLTVAFSVPAGTFAVGRLAGQLRAPPEAVQLDAGTLTVLPWLSATVMVPEGGVPPV